MAHRAGSVSLLLPLSSGQEAACGAPSPACRCRGEPGGSPEAAGDDSEFIGVVEESKSDMRTKYRFHNAKETLLALLMHNRFSTVCPKQDD